MNLLKNLRDILTTRRDVSDQANDQARIADAFPLVATMGGDELTYRLLQAQARDCPSVATYAELARAVTRMRDPRASQWLEALDAQFRQPLPEFDEYGERCGAEHRAWWSQQQSWWREARRIVESEAVR